jgi:hypothetical protein
VKRTSGILGCGTGKSETQVVAGTLGGLPGLLELFWARSPSVVSEATAEEKLVASSESAAVAFDTKTWRKPLAVAADAGFPIEFQSIFAWKALSEAAFVKEAVIDAHRSKHKSVASG